MGLIESIVNMFKNAADLFIKCFGKISDIVNNNPILYEVLTFVSWIIVAIISFSIIFYLLRKFNS